MVKSKSKNSSNAANYLDFEGPIVKLDKQIAKLKKRVSEKELDLSREISELETEKLHQLKQIYSDLTAEQTVQVARHPHRPQFKDYLENIVQEFVELHGDRYFGDDKAIITGFGRINREKFMIIGQHKGRNFEEKTYHNFGMPHPEGYRKALRVMKLAEKYKLQVLTFVDTPGAYPGIGAEERGQAQAIAKNLMEMSKLRTPITSIVIGEGGSGGALGLSAGDELAILEHAYYSVISPEGCAAILWKDNSKKSIQKAAEALNLTSKRLAELGFAHTTIPEPIGGAHRNPSEIYSNVRDYIIKTHKAFQGTIIDTLIQKRYDNLREIGAVEKASQEIKV